mmetsp:Transcript_13050/g.21346  ORF Transcript_13050/g.21346 Transcript_13050/m.21346 type:complete len:86 (-) Transcript_13050:140-397(-)
MRWSSCKDLCRPRAPAPLVAEGSRCGMCSSQTRTIVVVYFTQKQTTAKPLYRTFDDKLFTRGRNGAYCGMSVMDSLFISDSEAIE